MNIVENKIIQMLTGKLSLHEVGIDELQKICNENPYFSIVHVLLAKKMKQDAHPGFEQQLKRASLFFPDTQWLYNQIASLNSSEEKIIASSNEVIVETESQQIIEAERENANLQDLTHKTEIDSDKEYVEAHLREAKEEPETESQQIVEAEKENANLQDLIHETEIDIDKKYVEEHLKEAREEPKTESQQIIEAEKENANLQDLIRETVPTEEANSRLSKILASQVEAFNKPVEKDAVLPISNEPLHTVDYFASQGIKTEGNDENQLGKKVKKFTDWLKQMKRVSTNPNDLGTTEAEEKAVIKSAEASNQNKETVTEAMADVLIMQGKKKQAIEVFEKLSLLNPDKSAYFAAQINNLKRI